MASVMRSCLQSLLKIVNSLIGMAGLALIIYALWLFRVWQKHAHHWDSDFPIPWFIYASFGLGVILCVITCSGHIAAETANGHCLSCVGLYKSNLPIGLNRVDIVNYCIKNYVPMGLKTRRKFSCGYVASYFVCERYMVFLFLLVLLEAAVTTDVFLNHHWEEDFPEDPTGSFDSFKHFVSSNFDICKWIGISVVAAQGLSILLSMILRALGPDQGGFYDSDDDYTPARLPLLKNPTHPPAYVVGDPRFAPKSDLWNVRIQDK